MKNIFFILFASAILLSSCTELVSPADQNERGLEDIYKDAAFAEGIMLNGYVRLPSGGYSFSDVATDDAVSNNKNNSFLYIANGSWSAMSNPTDKWTDAYAAIQYLNIMLAETDKVEWAKTGQFTKQMFNDRTKGESYGLRALFMYYLLQAHGGWSTDGKLLGVPILTTPQNAQSDFKAPRNTFEECLQQIYKDLDMAESLLPLDFENISNATQIPAKYTGKTVVSDYNRVFGEYSRGRLTSRIVKAIRAQVSLLAASPAYNLGTSVKWDKAADDAAVVLDLIGGINGMASNGGYWYAQKNASEITGIANGSNPKEILWRTNVGDANSLEKDNYPPSLYGNGRVNPTQNLVDAFPMANGYAISDPNSGYDTKNPYKNRDPRLAMYIVTNGSKVGPSGALVYTSVDKTDDGLNKISVSTRTGYYMRKLLREDVNLNPVSTNSQRHYVPRMRYTEFYLAYAEAANEAWGPDGKGSHAYSARDVIAAIRKRAGLAQPDNYLSSITTKEAMRALIHNERRLELCFEGFRFWDLRRWKEDITVAAKGIAINADGSYTINTVEPRKYNSNMYYGPIPYSEVLKWGLTQNAGW